MHQILFQDDYVSFHILKFPSYYLKYMKDLHLFNVLYSVHLYTLN